MENGEPMKFLPICLCVLMGCIANTAEVVDVETDTNEIVIVVPDTKPVVPEPPKPDAGSPPALELIEVLVYVGGHCPACVTMFRDLGAKDYSKPVEFGRFRFTPVTKTPGWVNAFPTIHFPSATSETGWRSREGWDGLDFFEDLFDRKQQAVQPGYQQQYSSRSIWTYPGRIEGHLKSTHGFSDSELRGLSRQQMEQLHSNEHERGNPRAAYCPPGRT
jgi:hypothetical protein